MAEFWCLPSMMILRSCVVLYYKTSNSTSIKLTTTYKTWRSFTEKLTWRYRYDDELIATNTGRAEEDYASMYYIK
jgi:hypothetical protein